MASPTDQKAALNQHVHVFAIGRGDTIRRLKCYRCSRDLPPDQYSPLFGTKYRRAVRGDPGKGSHLVHYLHPWCHSCKRQAQGLYASHPLYSPDIDRYWSKRIHGIMIGASKRGLLCLVEKDDLLGTCLQQDNRCAITRQPMTFDLSAPSNRYTQASVDRIDSTGNYALGNVQIVCNIVNIMKQDLPSTEFYRWCGLVIGGRRNAEDDLLAAIG